MKKCEICQTKMTQIFQKYYCPNHDKHNAPVVQGLEHLSYKEAADSLSSFWNTEIRLGCLYKGLTGNLFIPVAKFVNPLAYDFAAASNDAKTWDVMSDIRKPSRLQFLSETVPASVRPLAESLGLELRYDDDKV